MITARDLITCLGVPLSEESKCPECEAKLGAPIGGKQKCISCGHTVEGMKKGRAKKEAADVSKIIKDLIDTDFGKDNDAQAKAVQLFRGLAFSDDPKSNAFMKKVSDAIGSFNPDDF